MASWTFIPESGRRRTTALKLYQLTAHYIELQTSSPQAHCPKEVLQWAAGTPPNLSLGRRGANIGTKLIALFLAHPFNTPSMFKFLNRYRRLIGVVLFLVLLWVVFEVSGLRGHLNLAFVRDRLLSHPVTGLTLFVLFFAIGNLIQIPGWIFLAAAVLGLGQLMGGIATYIAASISCILTFLLIRLLGGNALRQIDNRTLAKTLARLDAHPVQSTVLARIVFQTLPALNYVLAMSGLKLRHYVMGTLLGLPVPIALYCVFFDFLATSVFHIR
jgi:uncharacterized membrane protein YdjX (TVP38/TMEM64 family)